MLTKGTTKILPTNVKKNKFDTGDEKVKATTRRHEPMGSTSELFEKWNF